MRLALGILLVLSLFMPQQAMAFTVPTFPSCTAPSGSVIASYTSGSHGIVGNQNTFTGSDFVYQVTMDTIIQCFCPSTGSTGIQTNWWKFTDLSDQNIRSLESKGWYYIPRGDVWGLEATGYLATNVTYSCASGGSSQPVSTNSDGIGGGDSELGEVLGLAATGNIALIYAITISGLTSLVFGIIRLIKSRHEPLG